MSGEATIRDRRIRRAARDRSRRRTRAAIAASARCGRYDTYRPKSCEGGASSPVRSPTMTRFMNRCAKGARSIPHHANLSRLDHSSWSASLLPDTPSTEGLSRPWTHEQGLEISPLHLHRTIDGSRPRQNAPLTRPQMLIATPTTDRPANV